MQPRKLVQRVLFSLCITAMGATAQAGSVVLEWDPSTGADVAGYRLHYGAAPGQYSNVIDVGSVTFYEVAGLVAGQTYYFVVQAYSSAGLHSPFSAEVVGVPPPIRLTAFSANRALPIAPGTSVTWTVNATGGTAPYEYRFRRYNRTTGWSTVREYTTSNTYSWSPTDQETGMYALEVWVRTVGATLPYEALGSTGYFSVGSAALPTLTLGAVDFDGDGVTDPAVFRPLDGTWYVLLSSKNYGEALVRQFGFGTDLPVPGDYDGDGRTDIAIYRPENGTWYILLSSSSFTRSISRSYGLSTDIPVPADYDGDRRTDMAVYRPSNGGWYILKSSSDYSTSITRHYGLSTDVPVPADYDGDGRADFAVFRPSTGDWFVMESSSGFERSMSRNWGVQGDRAVPADFDGDGRADMAVYRPATGMWYILESSTQYTTMRGRSWGISTDVPVLGDYTGNGRADIAVFRPSSGLWFVWNAYAIGWGVAGDIPLGAR